MDPSAEQYEVLKHYIEENCGIHLPVGKEYLLDTRLAMLLAEAGCSGFDELYARIRADTTGVLQDKVFDAMTTNETLWFRDTSAWQALREAILPGFLERIVAGEKHQFRIWSAGCSTGQEVYSLAMALDGLVLRYADRGVRWDHIDLLATDISTSALAVAQAGRYDRISMSRGMEDGYRERYFAKDGTVSVLEDALRKRVRFRKYNLLDEPVGLGCFDLVLLRNVAIYFSDRRKQEVYERVADAMYPGGVLMVGASESVIGRTGRFRRQQHGKAVYYTLST